MTTSILNVEELQRKISGENGIYPVVPSNNVASEKSISGQVFIDRIKEIFSHTALGELLLGVLKTSDPRELNKTLRVIRGMTLLHGDGDTAVIYAGIRRDLEQQGNDSAE